MRHDSFATAVVLFTLTVVPVIAQTTASAPATSAPAERAERPLDSIAPLPPGPVAFEVQTEQAAEVQAHYTAAREYAAAGQLDQAVTELDAALDFGGNHEVLYLLADIKRRQGHFGEARLAAAAAAAQRPNDLDVYFLLGRLDAARRDLDGAIAALRRATLLSADAPDNPRGVAAWYELGGALDSAGYTLAAADAFGRFDTLVWEGPPELRASAEVAAILSANPDGALQCRLDLLTRLGRAADRVQAVRWAAETRPGEPRLARLYVRTLLDVGQPDQAFEYCRTRAELAARSPAGSAPPALLGLALDAAQAAGQLDSWIDALSRSVSEPADAKLARTIARRLAMGASPAAAARLWSALVAAQPTDADAGWGLSAAQRDEGNLAAALQTLAAYFRHAGPAAEVPPLRVDNWYDNSAAGEALLRRVEAESPKADPPMLVALGLAAASGGDHALAERLFESALASDPNDVATRLAWGQVLLHDYAWDGAQAQADALLKSSPTHAGALALRAAAEAGRDEQQPAEADFKAALDQRPDDLATLMGLAQLYRRTGNALGAQRYFQRAWALDPLCSDALEDLIDSYLESGKREIARGLLSAVEAADLPEDVQRRVRTTLQFADQPLSEEHLAALQRQFDQSPRDVRTGQKLAAGFALRGEYESAADVLQKLRAAKPSDEHVLYLWAHVQMRRYELADSITALEQLTKRYPNRRPALERLASANLADFRVPEARAVFQRLIALAISPRDIESYRAELLSTYVEFREYDAGLHLVDEWLAAEPQHEAWARARLRVLMAADRGADAVAFAAERLALATSAFKQAGEIYAAAATLAQRSPNDAERAAAARAAEADAAAKLSTLHSRRGEYVQVCQETTRLDGLVDQIRGWLKDDPDQMDYHGWLIETLLAQKDTAAALQEIGALRLQSPSDVLRVFVWRARAYADAGQTGRAVDELLSLSRESFVTGTPGARAQIRQEIVRILVEAVEVPRALELCDAWAADVPASDKAAEFEVLVLRRFVLQARNDDNEVVRVSEKLLALDPQAAGLNNDLAYTWAERGERLDRALTMSRIAVANDPLNAAYLDTLGWIYYKLGDFVSARRYLIRATQLADGQDAVIFDHNGDAAYRARDLTAARQAWDQAATLLGDVGVEDRRAQDTELLSQLRTKLEAVDAGRRPALSPTAFEQQNQSEPVEREDVS